MASKQQQAKERQGYETAPVLPVCSTCQHYTSRMVSETTSWGQTFEQEKGRPGQSAQAGCLR